MARKNEIKLGAVTTGKGPMNLANGGREGAKWKPLLIRASKLGSVDVDTGEPLYLRVEVTGTPSDAKKGITPKDKQEAAKKVIVALKLVMKREQVIAKGLKVGIMDDGDVAIYRPETDEEKAARNKPASTPATAPTT